MSDTDNGWGATFHRHAMSNEIHRDGGQECTSKQSPHEVYVFDPDFLREHDAAVWDQAIAYQTKLGLIGSYVESYTREHNPYR